VPISTWVNDSIRRWLEIAGIHSGRVFRAIDKKGRIRSERLSPQAIFSILRHYAERTGVSASPHDMRRTYAHLAYSGRAPLEQIQFSLGHASVVTTERYLGTRQDLKDAPGDHLGLL
jgi:integrase